MADVNEFPARGKVVRTVDGGVIFNPAGTNYELQLTGPFNGPVGQLIEGRILVKARKVYSVPSGGNFISPIFGTPRIIQGRVRHLTERSLIVQAGAPVIVELPEADNALDLNSGGISVNSLVNVVALPGASFELLGVAVLR